MEKQGRGVLFSGLSAGSPLMSCNPTLEVSRSPGVLSTPLPWVPAFTHPHLARGRMECSRCYWRSALFFPSSLHIVGSPLARHSSKYFIRVGHLFSARILIDKCYHTPFFLFQSAPWSLLLLFKKNFPLVFSASRKISPLPSQAVMLAVSRWKALSCSGNFKARGMTLHHLPWLQTTHSHTVRTSVVALCFAHEGNYCTSEF